MINFASTCKNLLKHSNSAEFLLMEGSAQGAPRKELQIASFVERFKQFLWENLVDNCNQHFQQNA